MNDTAAPQAREVRAHFDSPDQMQDAVSRLSVSGFDRADMGLDEGSASTEPASTESDARQGRTLGSSMAASAAGIAAAGVVVATGGAAIPAVAAAVAAGGAAGGAMFAGQTAVNRAEQHGRDARAETGDLILTVRVASPAKRDAAEAMLRAAGARDIQPVFEENQIGNT